MDGWRIRDALAETIDFGAISSRGAAKTALAQPYGRAADNHADHQRQNKNEEQRRRQRECGTVVGDKWIKGNTDNLAIGESEDQ